jgi:hypothetical protein
MSPGLSPQAESFTFLVTMKPWNLGVLDLIWALSPRKWNSLPGHTWVTCPLSSSQGMGHPEIRQVRLRLEGRGS